MMPPKGENSMQHHRDVEAHKNWLKKDCCACFTMLSRM